MKTNRWASLLLIVALGLALLYFTRTWWLTQAASWLVYSRQTDHADGIFVLGGDAWERGQYAAQLYKNGVSTRIITTGEPVSGNLKAVGLRYTEAELGSRVLISAGVPAKAITVLNEGDSTYDEANIARRIARLRGYHTILVVSSPFHMRRASLIFSKIFQGSGVGLYFSPVPESSFQVERWWERNDDTLAVLEEYIKLARYAYLYLLRSGPVPEPESAPAAAQ